MVSRSLSDDPQFRTLYLPDDYPWTTESAVWYLPVVLGSRIVGYLWAAATDDAISVLPHPAALIPGIVAGTRWTERTRWAKAKGIPPLVLLRLFAGRPEDPKGGYLPPVEPHLAPSLDALRELAARTGNVWPLQGDA